MIFEDFLLDFNRNFVFSPVKDWRLISWNVSMFWKIWWSEFRSFFVVWRGLERSLEMCGVSQEFKFKIFKDHCWELETWEGWIRSPDVSVSQSGFLDLKKGSEVWYSAPQDSVWVDVCEIPFGSTINLLVTLRVITWFRWLRERYFTPYFVFGMCCNVWATNNNNNILLQMKMGMTHERTKRWRFWKMKTIKVVASCACGYLFEWWWAETFSIALESCWLLCVFVVPHRDGLHLWLCSSVCICCTNAYANGPAASRNGRV